MCQGVFTQCRSVAHISPFSFQFFSISILAPMGHSFHPNSRAIWGTFHPIYLLLMYRALTIPYIINGASYPPIFGCFSLHITSPITKGCIHSHRVFFHPVSIPNNFFRLMGHFILPIVIFTAVIYPTFGTHGHQDFSFDCPYLVSGPFSETSISLPGFLFLFIKLCLFSLNHVFSRPVFQFYTVWGMKPSHLHCSSLILTDFQPGVLNLPIYHSFVGYSFLPTNKYTNHCIYPGFLSYIA